MSVKMNVNPKKKNISAASANLVKAISAAVPILVLADATTISAAISRALPSLIDAVQSLAKGEPTLGQSAWILVRTTYSCAIAKFLATVDLERRPEGAELQRVIQDLLDRAHILAEDSPQVLAIDHIYAPLKIAVFRDAARRMPQVLNVFNPQIKPNEIRKKFEDELTSAFGVIRDAKPDEFKTLEDALSSPLSQAYERRKAQCRHEEFLIRAFTQHPIFGQEETGITLQDLYVPQRCLWLSKVDEADSKPRGRFESLRIDHVDQFDDRDRHQTKSEQMLHVASLHDVLNKWLANRHANDSIRVVAGGPGSGKSTFAKALAIEVIDQREYDVLFVPLQEIEPVGNFETRISDLFKNRTELGFDRVESPLRWLGQRESAGSSPDRPLLLICDGLDEIAPPGSDEAADVTADFIRTLDGWIRQRNSGGCFVRAVILGRTIAAEEAFSKLGVDIPSLLRVAGFLPVSDSHEWRTQSEAKLVSDIDKLADRDERQVYWENWCRACGEEETQLPEALQGESAAAMALQELTTEPLLLYLLIWTGFLSERWQEAAENRNVVYEEIFKRIYLREWGKTELERSQKQNFLGGGHSLSAGASIDDFFLLQETLGLASWATGARTVSNEAFDAMFKIYLDEEQRDELHSQVKASLKSVALQSYTRNVGGESAGFEFVHKTLGEYLIARGLVAIAIRSIEPLTKRVTDSRCRTAASTFATVACRGLLTNEICRFLEDEVRMRFSDELKARSILKTCFVPMINSVLSNGLPMHQIMRGSEALPFSMLENYERGALDALWAIFQFVAHEAYIYEQLESGDGARNWEAGPIEISWQSKTSFSSLFYKLSERGYVLQTQRLPTFDFLGLSGQEFSELSCSALPFNLHGLFERNNWNRYSFLASKFVNVSFVRCAFRGVDFRSCKFEDVDFFECDMESVDFEGAEFSEVRMYRGNFSEASFARVEMSSVSVVGSKFVDADLIDSRLEDVNFSPVIVRFYEEGSDKEFGFSEILSVDLRGVNFSNSSALSCDFRTADLSHANFENADLTNSNFSWANVLGVEFGNSELTGAKFPQSRLNLITLSEEQRSKLLAMDRAKMQEEYFKIELDLTGGSLDDLVYMKDVQFQSVVDFTSWAEGKI